MQAKRDLEETQADLFAAQEKHVRMKRRGEEHAREVEGVVANEEGKFPPTEFDKAMAGQPHGQLTSSEQRYVVRVEDAENKVQNSLKSVLKTISLFEEVKTECATLGGGAGVSVQ